MKICVESCLDSTQKRMVRFQCFNFCVGDTLEFLSSRPRKKYLQSPCFFLRGGHTVISFIEATQKMMRSQYIFCVGCILEFLLSTPRKKKWSNPLIFLRRGASLNSLIRGHAKNYAISIYFWRGGHTWIPLIEATQKCGAVSIVFFRRGHPCFHLIEASQNSAPYLPWKKSCGLERP